MTTPDDSAPEAVLAVGILIPLSAQDHRLADGVPGKPPPRAAVRRP